MKKFKVFAAIPIYKNWEPDAKESFDNLLLYSNKSINHDFSHVVELRGDSLISRARNRLHDQFLKSDADYLFFYDSDIVCYNVDAVEMMIGQLQHYKIYTDTICGGAYVYRAFPIKPAFRIDRIIKNTEDAKRYDFRYIDLMDCKIVGALYVSTGFMLIPRMIAERMTTVYNNVPFQPIKAVDGEYLSEDWSYCYKAREMGFESSLFLGAELGHIGQYPYRLKDFYSNWIDNPCKQVRDLK